MSIRNLFIVLIAFMLISPVKAEPNDASLWTIELSSTELFPSGSCRIYDDSHRLMLEGTLKSGKMDGTWTSVGSDGAKLMVWSYQLGIRNGPVQMWYGAFRYPDAAGRLKLVGVFANGQYDGEVIRYYPSGDREIVRIYEHGVHKSSRYWFPNGIESSTEIANKAADFNHQADLDYYEMQEDMLASALKKAHRIIANQEGRNP